MPNKDYIYIIFIAISFLFYGNSIFNKYALDDAIVITQNEFTKDGFNGIKDILIYDTFTGFFGVEKKLVAGGRYRPLSLITFAIEYELFGLNPHISHLINIFLYSLVGILIFLVLSQFFNFKDDKPWYFQISFITVLFYIIHPIHTEVVTNIKGRDEIIALLGALGATYYSIRYLNSTSKKFLVYSFLCFTIGLFSKENTITFLAIIPVSIFYFRKEKIKNYIIVLFPLIIASGLFLFIRHQVIGDSTQVAKELLNNPFLNATTNQENATIAYTMLLYLKLLIFPHPLTFDYYPYHISLVSWTNTWVIFSILIYTTLIIFAITGIKKRNVISYGIWFYLITVSIVSNIPFVIGTFMNERFMFMPSVGFCLIIAFLFSEKLPKLLKYNSIKIQYLLIILIISFSFIKTFSRNKAWKDDFTLFSTDIKISKNSAKSNCSYGGALLEKSVELKDSTERINMRKNSIKHLKKATAIHPNYFDAILLLGNAYAQYNEMYDSSIFYYNMALKLNPDKNIIYNNIDIVLNNSGDVDLSINEYLYLYKLKPKRFETNYKLGYLYGRYKNDLEKSIFYLEKAREIIPDDFKANKDLGVAYGLSRNFEVSRKYLEKALELNANDLQTYQNLVITYTNLGEIQKANELILKINKMTKK